VVSAEASFESGSRVRAPWAQAMAVSSAYTVVKLSFIPVVHTDVRHRGRKARLTVARATCCGKRKTGRRRVRDSGGKSPVRRVAGSPDHRITATKFRMLELMLVCGCGFVREVLIVQDCVEYQGVGADGLTAIDGVVSEQEHVALAKVRVDDNRMLGNG
jgi:hypothetical protein